MAFLKKPPKPPKPANEPILAKDTPQPIDAMPATLITTGPFGLKRKATTQRTSLIGG